MRKINANYFFTSVAIFSALIKCGSLEDHHLSLLCLVNHNLFSRLSTIWVNTYERYGRHSMFFTEWLWGFFKKSPLH